MSVGTGLRRRFHEQRRTVSMEYRGVIRRLLFRFFAVFIDEPRRVLIPAYFAFAIATGIAAIAAHMTGGCS